MDMSPDGDTVFLTGESNDTVTRCDMTTVAFDRTGASRWSARHDVGGRCEAGRALALSPDGATLYVTGSSAGPRGQIGVQSVRVAIPPTTSFATVGYDARTGVRRWSTLFNRLPVDDDVAAGVAVARDGSRVYVTGTTLAQDPRYPRDFDFTTVAYDA